MTLTSWARQAIRTRSAWRSRVMSRQPTTRASARSCSSSARAGRPSERAVRVLSCPVLGQVPDVPLVHAQADPLVAALARGDRIHDARHGPDHPIEVERTTEVRLQRVVFGRVVVAVERDVVGHVPGEVEDGLLPGPERRHLRAGAPAGHELDRRVDQAHGLAGLGRQPAVFDRGLLADLPRPVHLVAQAPQPDAVRVGVAVGGAPVRRSGCRSARCSTRPGCGPHRRPRVPRLTASIGSAPASLVQAMNSSVPTRFGSIERHARSSRRGTAARGPTPSSQS